MKRREDLLEGVVTLVFTDIEGSTRLLDDLGDSYAGVLTRHRRLLRAAFAAGGGIEVDTQGDAFLVVFSDAGRALGAVAEAQRALAEHPWPDGHQVRVRIGVHTGEPMRTDEGYVGLVLHQGARIMSCAHGQQVVVSAATAAAVGTLSGLALRDLGEHRLKDLSEPQRLYQLAGRDLRGDFPPLKTLGGYFTNLPTQSSALLGRRRELQELGEALTGDRLVTLTGPGGIGKTRLALQAGADALDAFPGGVFFCDLAPIRRPDLVAATIAQTIGLREQGGDSIEQAITDWAVGRSVLLVIDNFEQVLDAAPVVGRLLRASPDLRVLATSRAPLRIAGERELLVESLALPDAVALFDERASLLGDVKDGALPVATVEAICERLDRLPLAIELAAARLRVLTPAQLLARLEQRLAVLTGGARDAPDRQRTLRATIDWSYELLPSAQQTVLRALGVFVGGCTLESAQVVAGASLDDLEAIVEQNLLRHRDGRYSMLETVREYALEQLDGAGELQVVRRRHAEWALGLLSRADVRGAGAFRPLLTYLIAETELENVREAIQLLIERQPDELASHILVVGIIWDVAARWREGIQIVHAVDVATTSQSSAVACRIQASLAYLRVQVGDLSAGLENAVVAIDEAERAGDDWALICALLARAFLASALDETGARAWAERALEIARARDDPLVSARCLVALGIVIDDEHSQLTRACYAEAMELAHAHGDLPFERIAAHHVAAIALQDAQYHDAAQIAIGLLANPTGDSLMKAIELQIVAVALAGTGDHVATARLMGAADAEIERFDMFQSERDGAPRSAGLARIEALIGTHELNRALLAGRRMPLDEAVALAHELASPTLGVD